MEFDHPKEINYLSSEDLLINLTGAFIHQQYTNNGFRNMGFGTILLEEIEKDAREIPDIDEFYVAADGSELPAWGEKKGYTRVGKECISCALYGHSCQDVPMFKKKCSRAQS